jgi:hypothetical protein
MEACCGACASLSWTVSSVAMMEMLLVMLITSDISGFMSEGPGAYIASTSIATGRMTCAAHVGDTRHVLFQPSQPEISR